MDGMELLRAGLQQDVVLIRHAEPIVEPDRPPSEWQLSSRGKELSHALGAYLSPCGLRRIVTSPEEKARSTASVVADVLGLSVITDDRLREVQRPWMEGNFVDAVTRYLQGNLIEDWEPIEQVVSRLEDSLISHSGDGPIGVVTHGTAMACLVGANAPTNRALFWSDLTMPDAWALSGKGTTRLYHLET
jgi:broad specificity phosphatase PhoE